MDNKNINPNPTKNVISSHSSAPASQGAARPAVGQGNNSPEIAAELQIAPQLQDPLQASAIRKAYDGSASIDDRYAAARNIQDLKEQEKAFCAIVESIRCFDSLGLGKLKEALQGLPQSLKDATFFAVVSSQSHLDLSKNLDIAQCIQNQNLRQQALLAIFEEGRKEINPLTLEVVLEAYSLLNPSLQNPVLRNELFKHYFDQYRILECEFRSVMKHKCSARSFMELIQNVFESANEEEKRTILFGIAKNINVDPAFGYYSGQPKDLFKEIQNRCSKALQQEFAYALLNQTLKGNGMDILSPYGLVLEIFMPFSSVGDEDIDELIANVLSKEQPSFVFDPITEQYILDPIYKDVFCHSDGNIGYSPGRGCSFQKMCTAVLKLYMPSGQISFEKKNFMIETMVCNQSLSKGFRKKIIEKYIQDPNLAEDLLYIVNQDLSDKRFKKTKLAARDEDQS